MLPSDFSRRNVVLSFQEDAIGISPTRRHQARIDKGADLNRMTPELGVPAARCWCALCWKMSPCWRTSTPFSRCRASAVFVGFASLGIVQRFSNADRLGRETTRADLQRCRKSSDFYITTPQLPQSRCTVAGISSCELALNLR
jgi:hypothetical protein